MELVYIFSIFMIHNIIVIYRTIIENKIPMQDHFVLSKIHLLKTFY